MLKPSFSEVKKIAQEGGYRAVPLCVELLADLKTPVEVTRILRNVSGPMGWTSAPGWKQTGERILKRCGAF